jgi:hypothetical protein
MVIPVGMDYTATVQGSAIKLVQCEQCQQEYLYQMTRSAFGESRSVLFLNMEGAKDRAANKAQELLRQKLEKTCDPVPCPACGWYQQNMVARARYLRYKWMSTLAIAMLPIGLILGLAGGIMTGIHDRDPDSIPFFVIAIIWGIAAVALLALPSLVAIRIWLRRRFDPNLGNVEERKTLGQQLAMTKEAFTAMLQRAEKLREETAGAPSPNIRELPPK